MNASPWVSVLTVSPWGKAHEPRRPAGICRLRAPGEQDPQWPDGSRHHYWDRGGDLRRRHREGGTAASGAAAEQLGRQLRLDRGGGRAVNGVRTGTHGTKTLTVSDAVAIRNQLPLIKS